MTIGNKTRSLCVAVLGGLGFLAVPAQANAAQTVVSLTFGGGQQTQYETRSLLANRGMHATFFVNSGWVGTDTSGYKMPWSRLQALASDGNEVTGHSLSHAYPGQLSDAQLRSEICDDRANLRNRGFFPVASYAHPYAYYNAASLSVIRECGYTSARKVGGLRTGSSCGDCPSAESLPARDPFATRTPESVDATTTLADLQRSVMQAEDNGGGWVQFVFSAVCDGCASDAIAPSRFSAFLDWLGPRGANGTVVKTVAEATGAGASGYRGPGAPTPAPASPAPSNPVKPRAVNKAPGFLPLRDDQAAASVTRDPNFEPRPSNFTANHRVPTAAELNTFRSSTGSGSRLQAYADRVTGQFTGTTDEIIQWAAWKWGIDEDIMRAVAVSESSWNQATEYDYHNGVPYSFGLMQIKRPTGQQYQGWEGTFPLSRASTAFNVDFFGAFLRSGVNGHQTWMRSRWPNMDAADVWGWAGAWYSGSWYDQGAVNYTNSLKKHVATRRWEQPM